MADIVWQLKGRLGLACKWSALMDVMWPVSQITLSCILFIFIEMKFIHCHCCLMFAMKFMST